MTGSRSNDSPLFFELSNHHIHPTPLVLLERWQWMAVLARRVWLQQTHEVAPAGNPRYTAINQWVQFVTHAPGQHKRSLFALGKFEQQFVCSGVGKNGMRVEVRLILQSLKQLDELCTLGNSEVGQIQHSDVLPAQKVH